MKAFLIVFVVLVAVVIGLGFYQGWFSVASDSNDDKSNITLTVDQDKIQEDGEAAKESVQDLGQGAQETSPPRENP